MKKELKYSLLFFLSVAVTEMMNFILVSCLDKILNGKEEDVIIFTSYDLFLGRQSVCVSVFRIIAFKLSPLYEVLLCIFSPVSVWLVWLFDRIKNFLCITAKMIKNNHIVYKKPGLRYNNSGFCIGNLYHFFLRI